MPRPNSTVLSWTAIAGAAVFVGFLTKSLGWCLFAASVGWILDQWLLGRQYRLWLARPLRHPEISRGPWNNSAMRTFRSIRNARNRSAALVAALQRYRSTIDALPDAWIVLNASGEIQMFNAAAERLLGIVGEDHGKKLTALIRDPAFIELLSTSASNESIELASPVNDHARLEFRHIQTSAVETIVVGRDVSDLNRALSMRQDFIANVSHELRTPLTVIMGYLETLSSEDLDAETVSELLERLNSPTLRMKSMVDDLLVLTRLESAPMPDHSLIEPTRVSDLLTTVVDEARQLSQGMHQIQVDADSDLTVEAVPDEIFAAIMNLVSNAIRYSPNGGLIDVRWHDNGDVARFEIQDHGVGIAPEHITRITERFYRADVAGTRAKGGTGLGLAIVKHILRRHYSRLEVTSELGRGSCFYFSLARQYPIPDRIEA